MEKMITNNETKIIVNLEDEMTWSELNYKLKMNKTSLSFGLKSLEDKNIIIKEIIKKKAGNPVKITFTQNGKILKGLLEKIVDIK